MTRGGAAGGGVTSRYSARDQLDGGDGILDRGPVKSNLISQELLQDFPRGESRIQLLPDKPWQNWGYNVGLVHTADRGVRIQTD